ncbi:MAG: alpha/beta hydrolase [Anaerolineae bacterium]
MVKKLKTPARIFAFLSVGLSGLYFYKAKSLVGTALMLPKALGAALAPFVGVMGAVGAALGLLAQAPLAVIAGILGASASARHVKQVTAPHGGFEKAFGPDWRHKVMHNLTPEQRKGMLKQRWTWWMPSRPGARASEPRWERDVLYRTVPATAGAKATQLLCDVWQPPEGVEPSALAVVYIHGSAWHVGDKDFLTRPFFRHLAAQGHVVMDIAYRLCPEADVFDMVDDVKHAIAWIKANADEYGVNPERIVLGGGSAGGHLALLAGYAPVHPRLTPDDLKDVDTSARGVFAHYGAVDTRAVLEHASHVLPDKPIRGLKVVLSALEAILPMGDSARGMDWSTFSAATMIGNLMGGTPEEVPDVYELASPITHASPGCPPTLLLQGEHDAIMPAYSTRKLHRKLVEAGVPSIYVEFPQTNHGFDLIIPQTSPSAQAATYDVDRFLALMVN